MVDYALEVGGDDIDDEVREELSDKRAMVFAQLRSLKVGLCFLLYTSSHLYPYSQPYYKAFRSEISVIYCAKLTVF